MTQFIIKNKPLHYMTWQYMKLHYITLHYIALHYITLRYSTLHTYITLHTCIHYIHAAIHYIHYKAFSTLHSITLHYNTLQYVTLHHMHDMAWHDTTWHIYICQCLHMYTWFYICIQVADRIAYSQRTWPKWVFPYRLWRFARRFEHPKSTPCLFSFALILSVSHI